MEIMNLIGRLLFSFVFTLVSIGAVAQTNTTARQQDSTGNNIAHFSQTTTPVDSPANNATHVSKPAGQNTGSITGVLLNAQKAPVSYATVTLMRSDSTVVN